MTCGNNTFVVVGGIGVSGIILQSDPVVFPIISVSPTILNFDSVNVGGPSSKKEVTITNTGSANLAVGAIRMILTTMGEFDIQYNCSWQTIAPLASRTINVVFSPKSVGRKTASLLIPSNDPYNSTVTILLNGYGLPASNQPPTVNLGAKPSSGSEPLKVLFMTNAYDTDGVIVRYEWNFGDGTCDITRGGIVNHTYYYGATGAYDSKVKVTDNGGATAESQNIKINVFRPDLVVHSTSYDKKKRALSVTIGNIGKADIPCGTGIRVDIYVNGIFNGCAIYNMGINHGQAKTITKSQTPSGQFGIIVDPGDKIKETNETNNTWGNVPNPK